MSPQQKEPGQRLTLLMGERGGGHHGCHTWAWHQRSAGSLTFLLLRQTLFKCSSWCPLALQVTPLYMGKPYSPITASNARLPKNEKTKGQGTWVWGNSGPASLLLSFPSEPNSGFVLKLTSMVDIPNQREQRKGKISNSFILDHVLSFQFLDYDLVLFYI